MCGEGGREIKVPNCNARKSWIIPQYCAGKRVEIKVKVKICGHILPDRNLDECLYYTLNCDVLICGCF